MKKGILTLITPVIFVIAVFQLLGCSSPQQTNSENLMPANKPMSIGEENFVKQQRNKFEAVASELEGNRRLWQESNIVNYNFVGNQSAGGNKGWSSVLIKVRDSKAISIEPTLKSNITYIDGYEKFDTVDKMFNYIREELENGRHVYGVKYNKKFGYPEKIGIEYSYAIDAWSAVSVTKFETIK